MSTKTEDILLKSDLLTDMEGYKIHSSFLTSNQKKTDLKIPYEYLSKISHLFTNETTPCNNNNEVYENSCKESINAFVNGYDSCCIFFGYPDSFGFGIYEKPSSLMHTCVGSILNSLSSSTISTTTVLMGYIYVKKNTILDVLRMNNIRDNQYRTKNTFSIIDGFTENCPGMIWLKIDSTLSFDHILTEINKRMNLSPHRSMYTEGYEVTTIRLLDKNDSRISDFSFVNCSLQSMKQTYQYDPQIDTLLSCVDNISRNRIAPYRNSLITRILRLGSKVDHTNTNNILFIMSASLTTFNLMIKMNSSSSNDTTRRLSSISSRASMTASIPTNKRLSASSSVSTTTTTTTATNSRSTSFVPPSYVSPLILKRIRQIDTGIRDSMIGGEVNISPEPASLEDQLSDRVDALELELSNEKKQSSSLETALNTYKSIIENIKLLFNIDTTNNELDSYIPFIKDIISKYQASINTEQNEIKVYSDKIEEYKSMLLTLKNENSSLSSTINTNGNEISNYKMKIRSLTDEKESFLKEIQKSKDYILTLESTHQSEIKELNDKYIDMCNKNKNTDETNQSVYDEIKLKLDESQKNELEIRTKYTNLLHTVQDISSKLSLNIPHSRESLTNEDISIYNDVLTNYIEDLIAERDKYKELSDNIGNELNDKLFIIDENKKVISHYETQIDKYEKDLSSFTIEAENIKSKLLKQMEEIKGYKELEKDYYKQNSLLEDSKHKLSEYEENNEVNTQTIQQLYIQITKLKETQIQNENIYAVNKNKLIEYEHTIKENNDLLNTKDTILLQYETSMNQINEQLLSLYDTLCIVTHDKKNTTINNDDNNKDNNTTQESIFEILNKMKQTMSEACSEQNVLASLLSVLDTKIQYFISSFHTFIYSHGISTTNSNYQIDKEMNMDSTMLLNDFDTYLKEIKNIILQIQSTSSMSSSITNQSSDDLYKAEIDKLYNEKKQYIDDIEKLYKENQENMNQLTECQKNLQDYENKINELNLNSTIIEQLHSDLLSLQETNQYLEDQLNESIQSKQSLLEQNNKYEYSIQEYKNHLHDLESDNYTLSEQIKFYKTSLDSKNSEINQLNNTIESEKNKEKELIQHKDNAEREKDELTKQKTLLEKHISDIESTYTDSQLRIQQYEDIIKEGKEEIERLQKEAQSLHTNDEQLKTIQQSLEELQTYNQSIEENKKQIEEKFMMNQEALKKEKSLVNIYTQQISSYTNSLTTLNTIIASLSKYNKHSTISEDSNDDTVEERNTLIQQAFDQFNIMNSIIENHEETYTDNLQIQEKMNQLLVSLKDAVSNYETNAQNYESTIKTQTITINNQNEEIETMKITVNELENEIQNYKDKKNQLESLYNNTLSEYKSLESRFNEAEIECSQLNTQVKSIQSLYDETETKLEANKEKEMDHIKTIENQEQNIILLSEEVCKLRQDCENVRLESNMIDEGREDLEKQLEEYENKVMTLTSKLAENSNILSETRDELNHYQQTNVTLTNELTSYHNDIVRITEKEAIQQRIVDVFRKRSEQKQKELYELKDNLSQLTEEERLFKIQNEKQIISLYPLYLQNDKSISSINEELLTHNIDIETSVNPTTNNEAIINDESITPAINDKDSLSVSSVYNPSPKINSMINEISQYENTNNNYKQESDTIYEDIKTIMNQLNTYKQQNILLEKEGASYEVTISNLFVNMNSEEEHADTSAIHSQLDEYKNKLEQNKQLIEENNKHINEYSETIRNKYDLFNDLLLKRSSTEQLIYHTKSILRDEIISELHKMKDAGYTDDDSDYMTLKKILEDEIIHIQDQCDSIDMTAIEISSRYQKLREEKEAEYSAFSKKMNQDINVFDAKHLNIITKIQQNEEQIEDNKNKNSSLSESIDTNNYINEDLQKLQILETSILKEIHDRKVLLTSAENTYHETIQNIKNSEEKSITVLKDCKNILYQELTTYKTKLSKIDSYVSSYIHLRASSSSLSTVILSPTDSVSQDSININNEIDNNNDINNDNNNSININNEIDNNNDINNDNNNDNDDNSINIDNDNDDNNTSINAMNTISTDNKQEKNLINNEIIVNNDIINDANSNITHYNNENTEDSVNNNNNNETQSSVPDCQDHVSIYLDESMNITDDNTNQNNMSPILMKEEIYPNNDNTKDSNAITEHDLSNETYNKSLNNSQTTESTSPEYVNIIKVDMSWTEPKNVSDTIELYPSDDSIKDTKSIQNQEIQTSSSSTISSLVANQQNNEIPKYQKPSKWLDNADVDACMICGKKFNFFNRRHHCRDCGGIYCKNCSSVYVVTKGNTTVSRRVCLKCRTVSRLTLIPTEYTNNTQYNYTQTIQNNDETNKENEDESILENSTFDISTISEERDSILNQNKNTNETMNSTTSEQNESNKNSENQQETNKE